MIAVATLALGLGACVLMFNVAAAALMSPLSFAQPDRIAMIWQYVASLDANDRLQPVGGPEFTMIRNQVSSFTSVAAFRARALNLGDGSTVQRIDGIEATGDFFDVLGVKPEVGHFFARADETPRDTRPVVLSDALWRTAFGADRRVIGRVVSLNADPYVVVGVAPPGFAFPRGAEMPATFQFPARAEAWIPIAPPTGGSDDLAVAARLRAGRMLDGARAELKSIDLAMAQRYPLTAAFFELKPIALRTQLVVCSTPLLLSLLAAVSLLLLIACVNAAQLQLAQLQRRRRDLAVRSALGASAGRLLFGSTVEVIAIALVAGALGTGAAVVGFHVLRVRLADTFPLIATANFDARSVVFAMSVTLVAGLAAGLMPALAGSRVPLIEVLRRGGRGLGGGAGAERLRRALIVVELTMAVVLVAMAGLMAKSLSRQIGAELGFSAPDGLTFEISLPQTRYPEKQGPTFMEHPAGARFIAAALDRIRAIHGVGAAAMGKPLPLSGAEEWSVFSVDGEPPPRPGSSLRGAEYTFASDDMFRTLGTAIIAGRDFNSSDREDGLPVVIVNRTMATQLWPGASAIGKRIKLGGLGSPAPFMTVVGVAEDLRRYSLTDNIRPEMIVPYTQKPYPTFSTLQFIVRSRLPANDLLPELQRAIAEVDPTIPIARVRTVDDLISDASTSARFASRFMTAFGASALLLAMIGLYGVIAYNVLQRRQEFGVRRALGASTGQVIALVAREASALAGAGVAIGGVGALAAGFAIRALLYDVASYDIPTLAMTIVVLAIAGVLACIAPAWRAARVEPRTALEEI
jgi:predicted permease